MLESILSPENIDLAVRLLTAAGLSSVLGIERELANKPAGLRTYALVGLGAALFVALGDVMFSGPYMLADGDPMRMAAHVITGIGFLGAGIIIFRQKEIEGLTTAAGLWVAAGIGVAAGLGQFFLAGATAVLTLVIFTLLLAVERQLNKRFSNGK